MLKFFRTFRQKLIGNNQFSKYLIYALGEIILVVIGILIALQINNWNEDRKQRNKETYYLNSVNESIELSQNELHRVIEDSKIIYSSADELLHKLADEKYDDLAGIVLDTLIGNSMDWSIISLNDAGVREILNTGSLDYIRNKEIRSILASWDERVHKIQKFEMETEYIAHRFSAYVVPFFDASRFIRDRTASNIIPAKRNILLHDTELRNFLFQVQLSHKGMNYRYIQEKKFLDSLHTMIDAYLKKRR